MSAAAPRTRAICPDDRRADDQTYGIFGPEAYRTHLKWRGANSHDPPRNPGPSRPAISPTWRSSRYRSPVDGGRVDGDVRFDRARREYHLSIVNLIMIAVVGALASTSWSDVPYFGRPRRADVGRRIYRRQSDHADQCAVLVPAGGAMAATIGAVVGVPSLRIKGLYLAIATLAGRFIIEWVIDHVRHGSQAACKRQSRSRVGSLFGVR